MLHIKAAVFGEILLLEDVNAFNERLKEVLFNEQSGILETWSALLQFSRYVKP